MKKLILLFALVFALSSVSFAQHCPFDGYRMIVVHLTDAENKPVENAEISLLEIDNPNADACGFSKGLLNKKLSPVKTLLDDYLKLASIENASEKFCADCRFLGAGFYAAILPQSERFCMLYDSKNDLTSLERKFEISYGSQKLAIKLAQVYRLCLAEGEWSRIKPVEMRIKSSGKKAALNKPFKKSY